MDITQANNTTKLTGGSAIVAKAARAFNLSGTPANLNTAANDMLEISFTGTGTLANTLPSGSLKIEVTVDA